MSPPIRYLENGQLAENTLFYGDNLDVLRRHIRDETIDLVYLDPPFNSNANYNVLFAAKDGHQAAAQMQAFEDTWRWDESAARQFDESVQSGGKVADVLMAFRTFLGTSDMLAYLAMMAPRLSELHRSLRPAGSLFLHCDPTASHYLKLLLDAVFGPANFRNEIIWRRTGSHGKVGRFAPIHDTILFYAKDESLVKWRGITRPYMRGHVEDNFIKDADGWRTNYYGNVLTGSGTRGGESGKPWRGVNPTPKGRHWAIPGVLLEGLEAEFEGLSQHQKLDKLVEKGLVKFQPGQAWPIYERRVKPTDGTPAADIWAYQPYTDGTVFGTESGIDEDVRWLSPQDAERLGYPTQKPVALLERIIRACSDAEDVVLDPFCGCGTTIDAAQKLGRRWIGIDVTHLAISLIKVRLSHSYGAGLKYSVIGEPTTVEDAAELAASDKYQFQWWALGLVGARPAEQGRKKGADLGIDGRLYFNDGTSTPRQAIFSVKGGHLKATDVRDLRGVIEREKAALGVLLSFEEPTKPMRTEAAAAGFFESAWGKHPKLQILTVAELLAGRRVDMPLIKGANTTFKVAPRMAKKDSEAISLFDESSK